MRYPVLLQISGIDIYNNLIFLILSQNIFTGIARVEHACVIECDWLAKYGNYQACDKTWTKLWNWLTMDYEIIIAVA